MTSHGKEELNHEKSSDDTQVSISTVDRHSIEIRDRFYHRVIDSFKRADPNDDSFRMDGLETGTSPNTNDVNTIASTKLQSTIQPRHTILMSLGTGIGTGLLVANGKSLYRGGPGGLVIGYFLVSIVSYIMMQDLGELALAYPTLPGNFNAYQSMFISPAWGFATVYLSLIQWCTVLPLELITSSMVIKFWNDSVDSDVWVVIFFVFLLCIHYYGSGRCYACLLYTSLG